MSYIPVSAGMSNRPESSVDSGGRHGRNRSDGNEGRAMAMTAASPMLPPAYTGEIAPDTADRNDGRAPPASYLTVFSKRGQVDEASALGEVGAWASHYVRSHPLMSLNTVGGQMVLGVRAVQYLFVDLLTGRFQVGEFIAQAAFLVGCT